MAGADQIFSFSFVFMCVYLLVYLYDETGGERDGEKGGARGLDQIVMKDRGLEEVTVDRLVSRQDGLLSGS